MPAYVNAECCNVVLGMGWPMSPNARVKARGHLSESDLFSHYVGSGI